MADLEPSAQAGVVLLLGCTCAITETDYVWWAERLNREQAEPPPWTRELIASNGKDAISILGKYVGELWSEPDGYAALAEFCHRNGLGSATDISAEVYSMWQYYGDDPKYKDDVPVLLNATDKLFNQDPGAIEAYERFLAKYQRL